jgi:hypothetical protein
MSDPSIRRRRIVRTVGAIVSIVALVLTVFTFLRDTPDDEGSASPPTPTTEAPVVSNDADISIDSVGGSEVNDDPALLKDLQEGCHSTNDVARRLDTPPLFLSGDQIIIIYDEDTLALHPKQVSQCEYATATGPGYVSVSTRATSFDDGEAYWTSISRDPCTNGCNRDLPANHPNNRDDSFEVVDDHAIYINVKRERLDLNGPESPVGVRLIVDTVRGNLGCTATYYTGAIRPETFPQITGALTKLVDQTCTLAQAKQALTDRSA